MRNHLLVAVLLVVSAFVAEDVRACKQCIFPPPGYVQCGTTVCGAAQCRMEVTPFAYYCVMLFSCSENAQYCGSLEREPEQLWACTAPPTREWTLVAVKIKRNAGKAA
jgi:hypothetical protein